MFRFYARSVTANRSVDIQLSGLQLDHERFGGERAAEAGGIVTYKREVARVLRVARLDCPLREI